MNKTSGYILKSRDIYWTDIINMYVYSMPRGLKQKYDNSTEQIKCNSRIEQKSSYK